MTDMLFESQILLGFSKLTMTNVAYSEHTKTSLTETCTTSQEKKNSGETHTQWTVAILDWLVLIFGQDVADLTAKR